MSDDMGREFVYLSSHATNCYFIPNWGKTLHQSVKCGFIHVTYFCNKRLCIYVSALQLPISAFSKAFDCKGEEGSEGTQGEAREARESEGKQGEVRESDAAELRRTQPKGE